MNKVPNLRISLIQIYRLSKKKGNPQKTDELEILYMNFTCLHIYANNLL